MGIQLNLVRYISPQAKPVYNFENVQPDIRNTQQGMVNIAGQIE